MNAPSLRTTVGSQLKKRPALFLLFGLVVVGFIVLRVATSGPPAQELSCYEVKRGDFLISVVEGGTLEAVNEVSIRSEVEGTARIIFIVPEGSYVKKGDLVVELDSSSSQDAVNMQQINVEKAQFALVQSQQQLDIQKSIADSEIAAATLKVEFAESDLEKFLKGEALQTVRNAQIEITNVLESLQIAQERLDWSEKLYVQGFETKGNRDKDRLTVSQSKLKLEQSEKSLWMVETFDNPKKKRSLESALQEAKENLDRVKLQNERRLAQYSADVETQKKTLQLSQDKLDRDRKQLIATKMYAPQDGLAVYAGAGGGHWSSESMIEEGAVVRNRQEIIKLPDVSAMKLQVKIHESHITQLHLGQPAFVVLDALPDQRFQGLVNKVAPLPDSQSRWGNPDLKVYATEILVTDKLPDLKPGVSARAEIIITNLEQVLSVPIQAVTTRKGKQVVFLADAPDEPVPVTVGMYNTKFIEITSGLRDGARVLLAPPLDTKEKDLSGAILAAGEKLPPGATNRPAGVNGNGWGDPSRERNGRPGLGGPDRSIVGTDPRPRPPGSEERRETDGSRRDGKRGRGEPLGNENARQEVMKRFDTDGDGKLNDTEQAAMREWFQRNRGTNQPPRPQS